MNDIQYDSLQKYLNAYSFIEFSSGKIILNILKTEGIMRMVYNKLFEKYDLSEPKFLVLMLLSMNKEEMPLVEIGETMLVSRANMTTLISRMERDGLVKRKKNLLDHRSIKAHLTEKGRQAFDEVKFLHKEFSEKMIQTLTESERETLNYLLKKLQHDIVSDFKSKD